MPGRVLLQECKSWLLDWYTNGGDTQCSHRHPRKPGPPSLRHVCRGSQVGQSHLSSALSHRWGKLRVVGFTPQSPPAHHAIRPPEHPLCPLEVRLTTRCIGAEYLEQRGGERQGRGPVREPDHGTSRSYPTRGSGCFLRTPNAAVILGEYQTEKHGRQKDKRTLLQKAVVKGLVLSGTGRKIL